MQIIAGSREKRATRNLKISTVVVERRRPAEGRMSSSAPLALKSLELVVGSTHGRTFLSFYCLLYALGCQQPCDFETIYCHSEPKAKNLPYLENESFARGFPLRDELPVKKSIDNAF